MSEAVIGVKKIAYLGTGGTISTARTEEGALPTYSAEKLFERLHLPEHFDVLERDVFRKSSRNITISDMVTLALAVERCADEGFDGVVISHGTDTLEETVYALSLLTSGRIPVIVTGAMISPDAFGSDALLNLTNSFYAAADVRLASFGPLVCIAGQLHLARFAYKFSSTAVNAFSSSHTGTIGAVQESTVKLFLPERGDEVFSDRKLFSDIDLAGLVDEEFTSSGYLPHDVGMLTAFAGMDGKLISASAELFDGLVLAGTGGGHLSADAARAAVELVSSGYPVVLSSRCPDGSVLTDTYGGLGSEKHLLSSGLLNADTLSPLKARIRLILGLSFGFSPEQIFS